MQTPDLNLITLTWPQPTTPRLTSEPAPNMAKLTESPPPATQVSIDAAINTIRASAVSAPPTEPNTYTHTYSLVTYLRDQNNVQTGAASAQLSKNLSSHLSSLIEKHEPFRPGLFFSLAGALSRETSSYSNEARSKQLSIDMAPETMRPDFTKTAGIVLTSATLSIRTRDGDQISMNLTRGLNGGSLLFTFSVEGDLSEDEQLALEKLAAKLGEVADEFFRTGTAELRGLSDFDSKTFQSFSLSMNKFNGIDYDTLSYNYSVDGTTNTAHLTGEDTFGYAFDISSHFQSLLSGKNAFAHQSLEQYLTLIRQAGNEHQAESSSIRFMLDGLRSMLLGKANSAIEGTKENPSALERALDSFDSGIPDFKATFNSPVIHNPDYYTQVSSMHLTMGQTTRIEVANSRTLIQQESFYELSESHWLASPGLEQAHLERGNYRYINQHVRESITRTLDTQGGKVNDILVAREKEWSRKEQQFIDFKAQPSVSTGDTYRTLVNLIDQLDKQANNNHPKLLKLLEISHTHLFAGW